MKENELFEHRLKKLMNDLRFIVNSQNIDIKNLMGMVGIKENESMNETSFKKFLFSLNPQISE